jgi:hypothetical protein
MKEATMKTQLPATWKHTMNQLELEVYAVYLAFMVRYPLETRWIRVKRTELRTKLREDER